MNIQNVKFIDDKNDGVIITFDDDTTFQFPSQKDRYQHTDLLNEWLKAGNKIEAFKSVGEVLKDNKNLKIESLKSIYLQESTETISYKDVVYKGSENSASAIAGAVNLAQALGETSVRIVDTQDLENDLTFKDAMNLSALIAKKWRDAFFKYKELKRAVLVAQSADELELIKW